MREGMYLGQPPVRIGTSRARVVLETMLRGGASYGAAAGGGAPLAMPPLQGGVPRMPSNPQRNPEIVSLFPMASSLAKTNLRQQFRIGG